VGSAVSVQAIAGDAVDFKAEDVARDKMILALSADGKALAFGGYGPRWFPGPEGRVTDQQADEGFVFAVVRIDVQ
jgi:hypothetical protein